MAGRARQIRSDNARSDNTRADNTRADNTGTGNKGVRALHRSIATAWLATHSSPNTKAAYRVDLDTFGRWCASKGCLPLQADENTLVAFRAAREAAGDSPSTLRRRWSALSSFYAYALENDATTANPILGTPRPKVERDDLSPTRQLSPRAVEGYRALAAALDPRLDALVALVVASGLKIGEALAVDIEDIRGRPPRTTVTIRRRGVTKRIALDTDTARAVRRCAGHRRSGPLFISNRAGSTGKTHRLSRFGADHLIRQLSQGDGERVTANALRRFHVNATDRAGVTIDDIRDRVGIADRRGVQRYLSNTEPTSRTRPGRPAPRRSATAAAQRRANKNPDATARSRKETST